MKKSFSSLRGFTLIELLIVIAVLGVLAAGVIIALDPVDRINAANDAKIQNDVGLIGRAAEAYSTAKLGLYPDVIGDLLTNGDVKQVPVPPTSVYGAGYTFATPTACVGGGTTGCTGVAVAGLLLSKKNTSQCISPNVPVQLYNSSNGKSCVSCQTGPSAVVSTTVCP